MQNSIMFPFFESQDTHSDTEEETNSIVLGLVVKEVRRGVYIKR